MKKILNYLFNNNLLYILTFGICSSLAISNTFENSYIFGFIILLIFILSGLLLLMLKKIKKDPIVITLYILFVSILVLSVEYFLYYYLRDLYLIYNLYLPLIIVTIFLPNIMLKIRARETLTLKSDIKSGVGFIFAISIFGLIREILGYGTITLMNNISSLTGYRSIINIFDNSVIPNELFINPAGALILLGIIICIINFVGGDNNG